jgi:hypothetical protein
MQFNNISLLFISYIWLDLSIHILFLTEFSTNSDSLICQCHSFIDITWVITYFVLVHITCRIIIFLSPQEFSSQCLPTIIIY